MKFIRKKVEAHFLDACMRREKTLLLFMIQSSCDWDFAKINVKKKKRNRRWRNAKNKSVRVFNKAN